METWRYWHSLSGGFIQTMDDDYHKWFYDNENGKIGNHPYQNCDPYAVLRGEIYWPISRCVKLQLSPRSLKSKARKYITDYCGETGNPLVVI